MASINLRSFYISIATLKQTVVNVVKDDLIIVVTGASSMSADVNASCSDTSAGGSNLYRQIGTGLFHSSSFCDSHIFYAVAKATEVLTITVSTTNTNAPAISVHVVSGLNPDVDNVLDTYNTATYLSGQMGSTFSGPSITTTAQDTYILSVWETNQNTGYIYDISGGDYILRTRVSDSYVVATQQETFSKVANSAGQYVQSQMQRVGTSIGYISWIIAFKTPNLGAVTAFQSNAFQNNVFQIISAAGYDTTRMFLAF